jgi:hypothetical protein
MNTRVSRLLAEVNQNRSQNPPTRIRADSHGSLRDWIRAPAREGLLLSGVAPCLVEVKGDGTDCEQSKRADDSERNDAVDAVGLQDFGLDVREVEREAEGSESGDRQEAVPAQTSEDAEEQVSGYADGSDGNLPDHGVVAFIDDSAVPLVVDGARGDAFGSVVFVERESGNDDARQGKNDEDVSQKCFS